MQFTVTKDHIKLLRSAYVGWEDCEFGAPAIDCKRPYGNSSVELDIAEILGWTIADVDEGLTQEQELRAELLHRETQTALQIFLSLGTMEAGTYIRPSQYDYRTWHVSVEESQASLSERDAAPHTDLHALQMIVVKAKHGAHVNPSEWDELLAFIDAPHGSQDLPNLTPNAVLVSGEAAPPRDTEAMPRQIISHERHSPPHDTIPLQVWVDVDAGIAEDVRWLNDFGIRTLTSCEGGKTYRPYVMVELNGSALPDAVLARYEIGEGTEYWCYLHPRGSDASS